MLLFLTKKPAVLTNRKTKCFKDINLFSEWLTNLSILTKIRDRSKRGMHSQSYNIIYGGSGVRGYKVFVCISGQPDLNSFKIQ